MILPDAGNTPGLPQPHAWWLALLGPAGFAFRWLYQAIRAGFQSTIEGQGRLIKAYETKSSSDTHRIETLERKLGEHAADLRAKDDKIEQLEEKIRELESAIARLVGSSGHAPLAT